MHSIGGAPASYRMTVENQAECHRLILEDILYRVSLFLFESISIEKETVVRYTVILYGIYLFSLKILSQREFQDRSLYACRSRKVQIYL